MKNSDLTADGGKFYPKDMSLHIDCICLDGCETASCYTAFNCWDCDISTLDINEYYMVHDELWAIATYDCGTDVMLCIGCLEARLGDRLVRSDFTGAPVNYMYGKSERLINRLASE